MALKWQTKHWLYERPCHVSSRGRVRWHIFFCWLLSRNENNKTAKKRRLGRIQEEPKRDTVREQTESEGLNTNWANEGTRRRWRDRAVLTRLTGDRWRKQNTKNLLNPIMDRHQPVVLVRRPERLHAPEARFMNVNIVSFTQRNVLRENIYLKVVLWIPQIRFRDYFPNCLNLISCLS